MKGPGQDSRSRDTHGPYSESNNVCSTHNDHTQRDAPRGRASRDEHAESAGLHTQTGGEWLVERSERRISNRMELSVRRRHAMCGGATYSYSLHLHRLLTCGNWTPDPRTFCLGLHGILIQNTTTTMRERIGYERGGCMVGCLSKTRNRAGRKPPSEAPTAEPLQKFRNVPVDTGRGE